MRKVLAVFMAVMMIVTTFSGIMTVSAADVTTTLVEIALGNTSFSTDIAGTGTLTATDYIKEKYTFAGVMNTSWSDVKKSTKEDAKTIIATYAEPKYAFSAVDTSTLSAYSGIATGHSSKLMKMTQTANVTMFRLKDFYDISKLPATGKLRFSIDVYPTDVTPGTTESTTTSSVKSGTATLADGYSMRIGNSKGSGDASIPKTTVKANQWNTVTCEVALPLDTAMDSIRCDVATGAAVLNSYNTPFPATVFYDKLKIEYIGEAISGGGSTGGDDNTGDDNTGGEVVTVWEEVLNIPFENSSYAPAKGMNIWGKDADNHNTDTTQSFVTYADAGISKPNTTEDFGAALIKADAAKGIQGPSVKGLVEGRLNDFIDFTFEKGAKYKYSIWAYLANTTNNGATDTANMTLRAYGGTKTSIAQKTFALAKGQWQKLELEYEVADEYVGQTSGFRFLFGATEGTNYPEIIYMDNAKLEKLTEKVIQGDKTKVNIGFEDGTAAPSSGINIWGKEIVDGSEKNLNSMQTIVNWADETSISKPNSTENFGSKVLKVDGVAKGSIKGVHTGRINDIPADVAGITEGKKYTYSFWILAAATSTSTNTAKVSFTPYCNSADHLPDHATNWKAPTVTLNKGEWAKVTGSFIATADHVNMTTGFRLKFAEPDSVNYPTIVYMDNFNIVESDDTSASYDITVISDGNGKVTGSGTYKEGETATLTATPDAGYVFAGWYNGTTLLSKENPYEYTVDGTATVITGKFEKFVPNTGDNWKTIDSIDFEDATIDDAGTVSSGTTEEGLAYKMSALDGGNDIKVSSAVTTEANAGIGTSSNKVYKFARVSGTESAGMMRLANFFSLEELSVGDIVKVSFRVYPTDLYVPEGASDKTAGFQAFYSISGKYGSSMSAKGADSTGARNIKANEWNEIGFTTTITQEMLDASDNAALRLSAAGTSAYAQTLYMDDFKAEVYEDKPAADMLSFTETFDETTNAIIKNENEATMPYVSKVFTRKDNNGKYARFNTFGTGLTGSSVAVVTNAQDLSGVVAHSGTNAVKWSGRYSANGGLKIEDIFMGKFDKDDIGRKIRVSAWVYADKSAGAYKMAWDEAAGAYKDTGDKTAAQALRYSDEEVAGFTKTKVGIALGGPNDGFYTYRTGTYNAIYFDINWNEWTKIYTDIVITESLIDNGIYDGSVKNPLISAIRIDQAKASGEADQAVIDTLYIDDITVEEQKFNISGAIGSHMVYQKGRPIRVWGTNADIGEAVTVKFNGETKAATTDADKNWVAEFDKIDSYTRDLTIEISCPGEESVKYEDISIGEVILASGQSNMEWNLRKVYEAEDIIEDAETNENISILSFENNQLNRGSYDVLSSPKGAYWSKKDKATAEICSGVGYITAYNIAKKYNIPVAVVDANLSGSAIKAWLSAETIEARKDDVYKAIYEEMINKSSSVSSGSIWKVAPAGMYNSLLAPLDNYEIGIMLWYQGCSDSSNAALYNYQQYDLINSWREHFGAEDTPFYICQLAPYSGSYMNLRQVQLDTAKRMDNVHLIVTADLGPTGTEDESSKLWSEMTSGNEIHPVRKIPVAERIALNLYANYFGEDILYSGPEYIKMESKEDHAILHFKHIGSGIVKSDETKDITGFEISQDGTTFVAATAEILPDNTIKVYAEGITNPQEVRYCWVNWVVPEDALTSLGGKKLGNTLGGNLTNETGIPVGPFRATLPAPTIFAAETATDATGLDIDISVRNIGYSEASPRLIVGLYDGSRLVGLKSETIDFKTIDTKNLEFKFYTLVSNITANTTIKAFLWNDMGTMIPLTGVYPIER